MRHLSIALLACCSLQISAALASTEHGWATYNKDYFGQRFSPLKEIHTGNVGQLREVCRLQVAKGGSFHTGPIVVDGVMYFTTPRSTIAMRPDNCEPIWRSTYQPEADEVWAANRGLAYHDGRLFRGTADGRILALDAKTGRELWRIAAGNPERGEFFSSAPIAWNKLLFIGVAGGDWGIRGRMMAFDTATGREVWRFNTIPAPGEPGAETWERPETMATGGGGTWGSYALDLATGEVFVPVANPAPDFAPDYRPGANLFTNSVVVLDAKTGKLKWWYQLGPNDGHDYGLGAAPMLFKLPGGREAVAAAGKDGFVHVVERHTRRLLYKTPVTTIENAGLPPTPEGRRFCPGVYGGTEWNGPAFDAQRQTIFVGAVDWCSVIKTEKPGYIPGRLFMGGSYKQVTDARGWVTALDAATGQVRWKYHADAPIVAGITATAGGLLFTGDMAGNFLGFDSSSGKLLMKAPTGGAIAGGVISYAIGGRQYVATTSGNVSRLTFGGTGSPSIIVMRLAGPNDAPPRRLDISAEEPAADIAGGGKGVGGGWRDRIKGWMNAAWARVRGNGAADRAGEKVTASVANANLAKGKSLFAQNCAGCHGAQGGGLAGPSLLNWKQRMSQADTIRVIKNPNEPMPKLFPSILSEPEVRDIAAYLHTL